MIAKKALVGVMLLLGIGILLGGLAWILTQLLTLRSSNTIIPYTYIDEVHVGGMSKQQAVDLLTGKYAYLQDIQSEVLYHDVPVATFSADLIDLRRDIPQVVDHAFIIGRSHHAPSRYAQLLNGVIGLKKYTFSSSVQYDREPLDDFMTMMRETYERPAKNALFSFNKAKVTSFKAHENGLRLNADQFFLGFHQAVTSARDADGVLEIGLSDMVLEPEVKLSEANDLGIEEQIGEGTSNYSHSIPGRIHNVKLAASRFHGVIIPQGDTFSFVKEVGDISANTGYQPAYIIKNGRTVLGDGGGVCQVSTTLFRAALDTGLPITERNAHAYRVSYYENGSQPGLDATIFAPSVDLKILNDTSAAILIQTEIDEVKMVLTFRFFGTKDARKVEMSKIELWDVMPPPAPLYEDDPTLPSGVVKQVDYPAWGGKARFTYKVTKPDGAMFEKEFYSSYRPWQAVFLKGTAG